MAATTHPPNDWEYLDDPDENEDDGYPDWLSHPSLTAEERNPLMVGRR